MKKIMLKNWAKNGQKEYLAHKYWVAKILVQKNLVQEKGEEKMTPSPPVSFSLCLFGPVFLYLPFCICLLDLDLIL